MERLITDFCFLPAYQDVFTGETHLPLGVDGVVSSTHTLYGLPDTWVLARDDEGHPLVLKAHIIAGFMRSGRFYSPEELASISYDA
ncbi:MAG: hypothetical protein H0V62_12275 [Gammaproteobacteria bacterium]|nr:hypothetical protein [Gammaproteobacteria bacterium]MBA3731481.1 hypothetical protein [Gammaproteobacteria bacterium]